MVTFVIYFMLKLVLEGILSSCATLTRFYFDWDDRASGMYLAFLGLLMLPANLGVAILAQRCDDRELILIFQIIIFVSCLAVMQYSFQYSLIQYLVASLMIFMSTNALEGPNMSLLSKAIPPSWSRGIFNVGLLATEAGTGGRALGDVALSLFGRQGIEHLLNRTFTCFSMLSGVTLAVTIWFYDCMEPLEKDD